MGSAAGESDSSTADLPPVAGGCNSASVAVLQRWAHVLTTAESDETLLLATLSEVGSADWRVVRPSDEASVVVLLDAVCALAHDKMQSKDPTISVKAACIACRIVIQSSVSAAAHVVEKSTGLLAHHVASNDQTSSSVLLSLKQELVFDSIINALRIPSCNWGRSALMNAMSILRAASSEGGTLLTYLATQGLLATTNQVANRVLPTEDPHILAHCSTIFRNLSVDYAHHFVKLQSLPVMLRLVGVAAKKGWKDVLGIVSRAFAKLVFDEDCVASLTSDIPSAVDQLVVGLTAFPNSKIISARLGGAVAVLLERLSVDDADKLWRSHQARLESWMQGVIKLITPRNEGVSGNDDETGAVPTPAWSGLLDEAAENLWRLVGTFSLTHEGGAWLAATVTEGLVAWLQDRDISSGAASALTISRQSGLLALMCLSNLSFYFAISPGEGATAAMLQRSLGPILAALLFGGDVEVMVECTRVLGNLSSMNAGREWIETNRIDEACLVLLGHGDLRIVYNCFGVILNLTAADHCKLVYDAELCAQLLECTSKYHLLDVSEDGSDAAQISTVVEKILLNVVDLV